MILNRNSFIISSDTMNNYNQIKGRNMTSYFDENNFMKKIEVNGNGESIYFALNDSGNSIIGLNYMICSDMNISFENNEIKNVEKLFKELQKVSYDLKVLGSYPSAY